MKISSKEWYHLNEWMKEQEEINKETAIFAGRVEVNETLIAKLTKRVEALSKQIADTHDVQCDNLGETCNLTQRVGALENHDHKYNRESGGKAISTTLPHYYEPIEPVVSYSWRCTACGKNHGDGKAINILVTELSWRIKGQPWYCVRDAGGCGERAVKWLPDEPIAQECKHMWSHHGENKEGKQLYGCLKCGLTDVREKADTQEPNHLKWDGSPLGYVPPPETVHVPKPSPEAVETLKPCPFCGAEAEVRPMSHIGDFDTQHMQWVAMCQNVEGECNARILYEDSKESAIAAWNRRPIEDELRAENERLTNEQHNSTKTNWDLSDELVKSDDANEKLEADLTRANDRIERVRKVAIDVIPHKHGEAVLAALDSDKEK